MPFYLAAGSESGRQLLNFSILWHWSVQARCSRQLASAIRQDIHNTYLVFGALI